MQKAADWLKARWAQLRRDVWDDPSIRPVAAILLTALAVLIAWLTIEYAPGGPARAEKAAAEIKKTADAIDPFWGKVTIAVMTFLVLTAGFEPIAGRLVERWQRRTGKRWWNRLWAPIRWALSAPMAFAFVPAKLASFLWSFIDYILARPVATLAGAAWRGWRKRYVHFATLMFLAIGAFIAAECARIAAESAHISPETERIAPGLALAAVVVGLIAIIAIVRRWSWIEGDRDTFLIERGERSDDEKLRAARRPDPAAFYRHAGLSAACLLVLAAAAALAFVWPPSRPMAPSIAWLLAPAALVLLTILALAVARVWIDPGPRAIRVGFKEDLRDEALTALACLFFLIPLGLDLVQQTTSAAGAPAFKFDTPMPSEPWERFVTWLGYFGVELAKTVPFVDWSEVFHVANGSPIDAQTTLGSQLAFLLRAGLDLLFLAALLQAVQIATRLREQRSAFDNNRLPILEPFSERVEFARAWEQVKEEIGIRPSAQPAILDLPRYDAVRLKELIDATAETRDLKVRKAAAALLQKDYEAAPDSNSDTARFWGSERLKLEKDEDYRAFVLHVASGLDPDEPQRAKDAARRARLLRLVEEDWNDARARAQAVRVLGRSGLSAMERDALLGRLSGDADIAVRAAAAVALAKAKAEDAFPAIEALIRETSEDAIVPAQALAFALAHRGAPAEEIAKCFAVGLRPHAQAAALIQHAPMDVEAGKTAEKFAALCQTVGIYPGQGPFPASFMMGSAEDDDEAFPNEKPQRRRAMTRAFALGRFAVAQAEYQVFTAATGRPALQYAARAALPAIEVSWFDARAFCGWLEAVTGEAWRLPTEAEREYACRAGTEGAYSFDDPSHLDQYGWHQGNSRSQLHDVGELAPNPWGLWDMHGNVYDWCADPWHKDYENNPPPDERVWLENGDFSLRVVRGGSWVSDPQILRSAGRGRYDPTDRYFIIGFRVARTIFTS